VGGYFLLPAAAAGKCVVSGGAKAPPELRVSLFLRRGRTAEAGMRLPLFLFDFPGKE